MKIGLKETSIIYKEHLDSVLEDLDEMKSVISRTLPRFLLNMSNALLNFETALICDWHLAAIKYVQLEFFLRNLQHSWTEFYKKSQKKKITSDFVSRRIKDIFLQSPKAWINLMSRLASREPSDSFRYLQTLIVKKPPLWQNNDKQFFCVN